MTACGTMWDRRLGQRRSRPGFTLIELLVVVAIIALLVSVLLPSLNRAREQARRSKCGVNCRSIMQAMYTYAIEGKNDHMPWPWSRPNNSVSAYYWTVFSKNPKGHPAEDVPPWEGEIYKYLPNQSCLECPSDNGDKHPSLMTKPVWRTSLYRYWGTSYYYNCRDNLNTPDTVPGSIPVATISQLKRASTLLVVGDTTVTAHGSPGKEGGWGRFLWHNPKEPWANIGFGDGHVGYHRMDPNAPKDVLREPRKPVKYRTSTKGNGYSFVNTPTDPWLQGKY